MHESAFIELQNVGLHSSSHLGWDRN